MEFKDEWLLEGAIKATMGIIKKLLMWRTCYIAQKSENCLLFLAFKGLPPYGPNLAEE